MNSWTLLKKDKKWKKTTLYEWTSQASERSFIPNNIKSGFKKTEIWPLDDVVATNCIEPSRGFEESDQEMQHLCEEDSSEDEFGDNLEGGSSV